MEFDELINKINQEIENDCKQIISKVDTYKQNKTSINENLSGNAFDIVIPVSPKSTTQCFKQSDFSALKGKAGVYVFIIDVACQIMPGFNKPNKYRAKLRDENRKQFIKGDVLYIGKCKQLDFRMKSHMDNSETNRVGSLKLLVDERKNLIGNFTAYFFCLKDIYVDYYSIIATKAEKYLRKELSPLVGQ